MNKLRFTLIGILILAAALISPTKSVSAHPADMNFQTHAITVEEDSISILWTVQPGPALVPTVWDEADLDDDTFVDPEEASQWASLYVPFYFVDVNDGSPVPLEIEAVRFPEVSKAIWLGSEGIEVDIRISQVLDVGDTLRITNGVEVAASTNWFTLESGQNYLTFSDVVQDENQLILTISAGDEGVSFWDSGALTGSAEPSTAPGQTEAATRLTTLISTEGNSAWFYVTALAISVLLGAVHALTPGHGKAMVGAYLVGSRGKPRHAIALGGIVTLTHTGSVIAFGILALTATQLLAPTTALPLLELISGALIVGFGLIILRQRWLGYAAVERHRGEKRRVVRPQLVTAAASPAGSKTVSVAKSIPIGKSISVGPTIPVTTNMKQNPSLSWQSLVGLGVSGGLVPCPDAVAILLVATAINRLILGLTMTVAFSLGLALVLIAIGLAMVRGRSFIQRFESFERYAPVLPMLSALVVILLGGILFVKNVSIIPVVVDSSIAQTIRTGASVVDRQADVVFIANKDGQLYGIDLTTRRAERLTNFDQRITSMVVSPDHRMVAFSVLVNEVDGIYLLDFGQARPEVQQIISCEQAFCRAGQFHPTEDTLLVEWTDRSNLDAPYIPVLHSVALATGERTPIFGNADVPSLLPRVSPDGAWLAYVIPGATQLRIDSFGNGTQHQLVNGERDVLEWSPDGQSLVYTDYSSDLLLSHLYRFDPHSGERTNLTQDTGAEDLLASWSPDGEWLAIVRKEEGDFFDQLWLMRPDGSGARPISTPYGASHFEPQWSADGQFILTSWLVINGQHYIISLIDVETGSAQTLTTAGFKPAWVK